MNITPTTSEQSNDVNTAHTALEYLEAGLSVIPVKQDKTPAVSSWAGFNTQLPTTQHISQWYSSNTHGIGIICGGISGNIECLDIDEKYNVDPNPLLDQLTSLVDLQASGLISRLVHETSMNGGHHLVYRCKTIEGSRKLARRPATEQELLANPKDKTRVLLETRGTGGYFVSYPSPGYQLLAGSMTAIPEITEEERKILLECAMALNQLNEDEPMVTGYPAKRRVSIVRPGDDYNQRGDIGKVLFEEGWKLVYTRDGVQHWRRPGKKEGISATFGRAPDKFYVFSSSCSPLEPNTWYSAFALLALLRYDGDFEGAASDLAEQGFGDTELSKAETFLKGRYDFRYNEVTGRVEYRRHGTCEYAMLQDYDLNSINRQLQLGHIKIGVDGLAGLLRSEYSVRFDPFKEYYDSLPRWDQATDYIALLAGSVALKDESERSAFETYLRRWLVAAVACAIEPGKVNHTCLTLVGPQGRYKTTWLNRLVPEKLSQYIHVGTIDPSDKDTLIHLSECYMVNLDELETLNRSALGTLKSIMTWKSSRVRRPYAHFAEQLIRRASFVGSINRGNFLTDETGTRRFLVVEIEAIDMQKDVDMDQVHAQAYSLYKTGYRYWFDQDEIATVNEKNKEFMVSTTEDEFVAQYCTALQLDAQGDASAWLSATEVAQQIAELGKYSVSKSSARDFGYALSKAGCPKKKVGGVTKYAVQVAVSAEQLRVLGGVTTRQVG